MEKIISIICNVILFSILIFNVNNYPSSVLVQSIIILISLYIFYLIRYRRKYIEKEIIILHIICLLIQYLLIIILKISNVWEVSSEFMGLGAGPLGMALYFVIQIIFIILNIITNIFKKIINIIIFS